MEQVKPRFEKMPPLQGWYTCFWKPNGSQMCHVSTADTKIPVLVLNLALMESRQCSLSSTLCSEMHWVLVLQVLLKIRAPITSDQESLQKVLRLDARKEGEKRDGKTRRKHFGYLWVIAEQKGQCLYECAWAFFSALPGELRIKK